MLKALSFTLLTSAAIFTACKNAPAFTGDTARLVRKIDLLTTAKPRADMIVYSDTFHLINGGLPPQFYREHYDTNLLSIEAQDFITKTVSGKGKPLLEQIFTDDLTYNSIHLEKTDFKRGDTLRLRLVTSRSTVTGKLFYNVIIN